MSDSKDMHINESILSDEIREDLKKTELTIWNIFQIWKYLSQIYSKKL